MRMLALDIGDRRIGVAISDLTCTIAAGLTTIDRRDENVVEKLKALCEKHGVSEIIVGIPLRSNGTEGAQAKKVRDCAKKIQKELKLPLMEWDERLTSSQAEKALIFGDVKRAKRRLTIDRVAAVLILQNYLDNLNRKT